jgi:hypothetical protein
VGFFQKSTMAKQSEWPGKMLAVIKSGNVAAAVAQIKVAPTVKDLRQLQSELDKAGLRGRWRELDLAIEENMALLNAPRLHRSP